MKIFIAYASAGAGHRKAAEALYNYFKDNSRLNDDVRLIDILEYTNPVFKTLYSFGYLFLVNHAIWLWGFLFRVTAIKSFRGFHSAWCCLLDRLNSRKFIEYLSREQPDMIISTHFLPPEVAAYLKRKHKIKSKLVTVITDFGIHPFWLSDGIDTFIAASSFTKEQLIKEGIAENRIKELGIPIDCNFTKQYERNRLREKLGIEQKRLTVLITTGSFGIGPVEQIVDLLYKDVQIIVICANNRSLYAKLKKKNYPGVKVYGFVNNIHEFMAAADIVIAKPGGLTTSEILSMELAPIFICPIPGQETNNIKAMEQYGIGKFAKGLGDIKKIISDYKEHPEKLDKIKEAIRRVKKPAVCKDIYDALR